VTIVSGWSFVAWALLFAGQPRGGRRSVDGNRELAQEPTMSTKKLTLTCPMLGAAFTLLALAACSSGPNDEDGAGRRVRCDRGDDRGRLPRPRRRGDKCMGRTCSRRGSLWLPYGSATLIAPDRLLVAIGSLAPGAEFRVGPNPASPSQTIPIVRWIRIVQSDVDTVSLRGLPGPQGAMVAYLARPVGRGHAAAHRGPVSRRHRGAYQRRRLWERGGRAAARPNDSSGHARRFGATHPLPPTSARTPPT
jgi:hypothetical protein